MGKIDEFLMLNERIIKSQGKVQVSTGIGMPYGDLFLTNRRLIFIHSKGWSLLSQAPIAGMLLGKNVVMSLQDIKSVEKNMLGYLKVRADKEYQFLVAFTKAQGWVDAVLEARQQASTQSAPTPYSPHQNVLQQEPNYPPPPTVEASASLFCSHCGKPLKPDDNFCRHCGNPAK